MTILVGGNEMLRCPEREVRGIAGIYGDRGECHRFERTRMIKFGTARGVPSGNEDCSII